MGDGPTFFERLRGRIDRDIHLPSEVDQQPVRRSLNPLVNLGRRVETVRKKALTGSRSMKGRR